MDQPYLSDMFGGFPREGNSFAKSSLVILPVPYEQTVSYQSGTREGPRAIIRASQYVETYDAELDLDYEKLKLWTMEEVEPEMSGPEAMMNRLESIYQGLVDQEKFVVVLGGEHSLTQAPVRVLAKRYSDLSVLQIDAHADLRDSYWGTRYSHASVMRRVSELVPFVQLGIRSMSEEDAEFIRKKKILSLSPGEMTGGDWLDRVIERLTDHVYVTFDLDGLDPSIMPSVGTPEPGGLSWDQALEALRRVGEEKQVVGFDVMELMPIPGLAAPDFLAAKLTFKMIGYSLIRKRKRKRNGS
jgi:agmatinase